MTVRNGKDGVVYLDGACGIEDAEPLLRELLSSPDATVDWRSCDSAHTAVVQILLASQVPLKGPPAGDFLAAFVAPAIRRARLT